MQQRERVRTGLEMRRLEPVYGLIRSGLISEELSNTYESTHVTTALPTGLKASGTWNPAPTTHAHSALTSTQSMISKTLV
jgi:hypothetical protein